MSELYFDSLDFLFIFSFLHSTHFSIQLIRKLIKHYKMFKISSNLFRNPANYCYNSYFSSKYGNYVLLTGITKKISPLNNNSISNNIISSFSNSPYIENFYLNCQNQIEQKNGIVSSLKHLYNKLLGKKLEVNDNLLIKPNHNTNFLWLKKRWLNPEEMKKHFFTKLFLQKSPTIQDNERLFILGKILENKKEDIIEIKPYYISAHHFGDIEVESSSIFPFIDIGIKLAFIGLFTYLGIKYFRYKLNQWKKNKRLRSSIKCGFCQQRLSNILCAKCENVTNYCKTCYLSLQQKIERNEISLDDIKCVHCGQTLDVVNSLIVIQNNN